VKDFFPWPLQAGRGQVNVSACESSQRVRTFLESVMAMQVICPLCGQAIVGENEESLVTAADAHGDENHGMRAPREMILSNAERV